ncbi:MAG: T9SS type A sorting domain-containing protein [Lewinellaceae bacterium]|nr:T9SS type A sorting domain-containing protein [Saprospiraceae bacterium]MCB9345226.1 T9SS type A sorting domain-containing protein [Lewinellaceae bacterium]
MRTIKRVQLYALLALLFFIYQSDLMSQPCAGISFTFEHYEPCHFRAHYSSTNDCFTEIRYTLESGTFASWSVNSAAGFTADEISPSEIWIHHNAGFLPVGDQFPMLFTLAPDLNTNMLLAYLDDCAQIGCEIFGGIPIESCPDPQDASITGVKYRECNSLPYSNQTSIPDWTIQLLDGMGNMIGEQQTDADGFYAFYDLPYGLYTVKETQLPDWTTKVPASGEYVVDLAPSANEERNFGNCPNCSCDQIYLNLSQLPGSNDTNTYYLNISNNGPYCFNYIDIKVDTGQLLDWNLLLPNWTTSQQGPNFIRLSPTADYIPAGGSIPLSLLVSGMGTHYFTVSAFMGNGLGGVACERSYGFPSNPLPLFGNCCPAGSIPGPEMVVDGNFDSPPQFSWSGYNYVLSSGPGTMFVVTSAQIPALNSQWQCSSKSGSLTDQFLFVDGSVTPGSIIWEQPVTLTPGTGYAFGVAVNNLTLPTLPGTPDPVIHWSIVDGSNTAVSTGTSVIQENPDNWLQLCGWWTSPSTLNPPYSLRIQTIANSAAGNDFALDCITFRSCTVPCAASFINVDLGCGKISFNGLPTGSPGFLYSWDFGDAASGGNNFSNLKAPIHQFTSPGPYVVTLTVTDATNCTATYSTTITVPPFPTSLTITGNPGLSYCQGGSTTLSVSGGPWSVCSWSNGFGGQSVAIFNPGNYCVTCTDVSGCTATGCVTVNEIPAPNASISGNLSICAGGSTTLTASGGGSYLWSPGGATTASITVSPTSSTVYTVLVTNASNCTAVASASVAVHANPLVDAGVDEVICFGANATLQATTSGGIAPYNYVWTPGNLPNPSSVSPPATTSYNVVVTDANGCTSSDNFTVIVVPLPLANAGPDQAICAGESVTLTASGGGTYQWSAGGLNQNPITVTPTTTTTYTVTITLNGCTAMDQVVITVNPLPNANAGADKKICFGNSTTLIASGGTSYHWSPSGAGNPYTVSPSTTTTYTVTVTNANGCTATDQVMVTVNPLPIANAGPDQDMCAGQSAVLTATASGGTPPYTYLWVPWWPNNPNTVSPASDQYYTVVVKDANGCSSTDKMKVNVISCCSSSLVQNWDFSQSVTPLSPLGIEDIWGATNWEGIWLLGGPLNRHGDYWDLNSFNNGHIGPFGLPIDVMPLCDLEGGTPLPTSQGKYGGFVSMYAIGTVGKQMRQGIMNNLSSVIPNTPGTPTYYKVSMKIACPCYQIGASQMDVYGVYLGAKRSTIPACGFPDFGPLSIYPSNGNLFGFGVLPCPIPGVGAKWLGRITLPNNKTIRCNEDFETYFTVFNAQNLSLPIDRIFLTRRDYIATGKGYLAIDDVCIEKVSNSNGDPICDCSSVATGTIYQGGTGVSKQISCGTPAPFVQLPCRRQGYNTSLLGTFPCNTSNCADGNNSVSWVLTSPGQPTHSGTSAGYPGYPNFSITMPWNWFPLTGGSYTLTVTRMCGNKPCTCDFKFDVAACPCICDNSFYNDVNQGFSTLGPVSFTNCSRKYKPAALCPNDAVTWVVPGVGNFGPSFGNNVQTITFPGPGTYQVCMTVTRTQPGGQTCVAEKCPYVNINCLNNPSWTSFRICGESTKLRNGDLRDTGVIVGLLGEGGWMPEWDISPNFGDGHVIVEDSTGADDEGHLVLIGGEGNFSGITQEVFLEPDTIITLAFAYKNYLGNESPVGTRLEIRLHEFPLPWSTYQILDRWYLDTIAGWQHKTIEVDMPPDTSLKYLVICLQNDDSTRRSAVGLDNLELCTSKMPLTSVEDVGQLSNVKIYPNPNSGTFTMELSRLASNDMNYRVLGITGQVLKEGEIQEGGRYQTVQAQELPPGLYFLQVLEKGRTLFTEKFVKQ